MNFHILTLFPDMVERGLNTSYLISYRGVRRITSKVKTVIGEQAPNHGSYLAYARLSTRVNLHFSTKDTKDQKGVEEATE